ncbi:MAG TPA: hypothetical protein VF550_13175 [Polyangia bacterium]
MVDGNAPFTGHTGGTRAARGGGTAPGHGAAVAGGITGRQRAANRIELIHGRPSTGQAGKKRQHEWHEALHVVNSNDPADLGGKAEAAADVRVQAPADMATVVAPADARTFKASRRLTCLSIALQA